MRTYEIKVYDKFEVFFNLVICNTRKQMHRAIKKHDSKSGCKSITTGMFSPTSYLTHSKLPGKFRSNVLGTMYLNIEDLKKATEIVVHECAHAIFAFNHYVLRYYGCYSEYENHGEFDFFGGGTSQEAFCYYLENIYRNVWRTISIYEKENHG